MYFILNNFSNRNYFHLSNKIIHPETCQKPFIWIIFDNLHPQIFAVQNTEFPLWGFL